jgi:hypothetical protein
MTHAQAIDGLISLLLHGIAVPSAKHPSGDGAAVG